MISTITETAQDEINQQHFLPRAATAMAWYCGRAGRTGRILLKVPRRQVIPWRVEAGAGPARIERAVIIAAARDQQDQKAG